MSGPLPALSLVGGRLQGPLSLRCRCCAPAVEDKAAEERGQSYHGKPERVREPLESFLYREGEGPTALLDGGPGSLEMSFTQPEPGAARGLGALFPSSTPTPGTQKKWGKVAGRTLALPVPSPVAGRAQQEAAGPRGRAPPSDVRWVVLRAGRKLQRRLVRALVGNTERSWQRFRKVY